MTTTKIDLPEKKKPIPKMDTPREWRDAAEWFANELIQDSSADHVSEIIGVLNAWLIGTSALHNGIYPKEVLDAVSDIVAVFWGFPMENAGEIYDTICLKHGGDPLLFKVGMAKMDEDLRIEHARQEKKFRKFPIKIRQSIERLCEFVYSQSAYTEVILMYANGENKTASFDPYADGKTLKFLRSDVRASLIKGWNIGCSFIIAVIKDVEKDQTIYGGYIENKRAYSLGANELKEAYENGSADFNKNSGFTFAILPVDLYN